MNPVEVSFAAAIGAAVGLMTASFLHIPWMEFPLMVIGLISGGVVGWMGIDVLGGMM